jgi:hypothetical protein
VKFDREQIKAPSADQESREGWGFVGVFLNELKTRSTRITTRNCSYWEYVVIQRVYLTSK